MNTVANNFFQKYEIIFLFLYGIVFFSMGLAILVRSRNYSRLTLAKSLPWLAGFGIINGFFEWGYIFIPLLTRTLGQQIYTILMIIHQVLLAGAFTCLFQFGIELLKPNRMEWKWIRLIPMIIFVLWLIGPFTLGFSLIADVDEWANYADVCSRYFLCIPGSVLSTIGLIYQQRKQIKPMKLPKIDNMIRTAAGALAAHTILSGIVVPTSNFFPASVINYTTFTIAMGAPPYIYRISLGLILLFSTMWALDVFSIETDALIQKMEEAQVISTERERMARDLHDGALQQVYASGLLAQSLKKHIPVEQHQEANQLIGAINQAIEQLREFLPQHKMEPKSADLVSALMPRIEEARRYARIETKWEVNKLPSFSIEQTSHLSALLNEAISNAIRHSKSERIEVSVKCVDNQLVMSIRDFGLGISPSAEQGYGLKNMRDRARLLGAELSIETTPAKGTVVSLSMPLEGDSNED